ncbi:MAG TPA: hypothetical protein VJX74_02060 [Blastocatellia bacterium]|nr:hypothetical protein [Blastocatellia bacterium]
MQEIATLQANLSAIQERAIIALLSHSTIKGAAKAVGVDDATLYRWLQDKDFHDAYMSARRESVSLSIARLQQSSMEAVNTLKMIAKDKEAPASSRVMAAKAILEFSIKAVEIEDMATRLAEVETVIKAQKKS